MENIEKGFIVIGDTHFTSGGQPSGTLRPVELFKPESECGIGEIFMGIGEDGEPAPMMKVDKQFLEESLKMWCGTY